jgi:hypothetical protein|nr:MAG TPA: hypothetical protein [Caudoviricetes sp.]
MPDEKKIISENPRRLLVNMNKRLKRMTAYLGEEHDSIQMVKHQLDMVYGYESIGIPTFKVAGLTEEKKKQILDIAKTYKNSSYSTITGFKKSLQNKGFQTFTKNMSQSQAVFWDSVFSSPSWGKIKELFYEDSDRAVATAERVERFTENPYSLEDIFSVWTEYPKEDKPNFRKSVDIAISNWNKLDTDERNNINFRDFVSDILTRL